MSGTPPYALDHSLFAILQTLDLLASLGVAGMFYRLFRRRGELQQLYLSLGFLLGAAGNLASVFPMGIPERTALWSDGLGRLAGSWLVFVGVVIVGPGVYEERGNALSRRIVFFAFAATLATALGFGAIFFVDGIDRLLPPLADGRRSLPLRYNLEALAGCMYASAGVIAIVRAVRGGLRFSRARRNERLVVDEPRLARLLLVLIGGALLADGVSRLLLLVSDQRFDVGFWASHLVRSVGDVGLLLSLGALTSSMDRALDEAFRDLARWNEELELRIEERTRENQALTAYNQQLIENMASGLVAIGADGTVLTLNRRAEELGGWSREDVAGQPADAILPDSPPLRAWLAEVQAGKSVPPLRGLKVTVGGGDGRVLEIDAAALERPGAVARAILLFEDRTEEARREEALRHTERLRSLGELAAGLAHEVRNPLAGMGLLTRRVRHRLADGDERQRDLDRVLAEMSRLERLVENLSRFARPGPTRVGPTSVAGIIDAAVGLMAPRAREQEVRIEVVSSAEAPVVRGDPQKLQQVLLNLLLNALDATPNGGTITVRIESADEGPRVRLAVEDTGGGIPASALPKVFNPFFSTNPGRSGLGLAIAKRIVDEHAGEIRIARSSGQGTVVEVLLPAVVEVRS